MKSRRTFLKHLSVASAAAVLPIQTIAKEMAKLQSEHDSLQYQRDRKVAYPTIEDQLDKIYHSGIDAWKADIKAVKDKFPKP